MMRIIRHVVAWAIFGTVLAGCGGPSSDALLDQAERNDLVADDKAIARAMPGIRDHVMVRLTEIDPTETEAVIGLVRLAGRIRYLVVAEQIGQVSVPSVRRAWVSPDHDLAGVLAGVYAGIPNPDLRRQMVQAVLEQMDVRTMERFLQTAWDAAPTERRPELAEGISGLLHLADPASVDDGDPASGWAGFTETERLQRQGAMGDLLQAWAVPTLQASWEGEGIDADAVPRMRNLIRAHRLEPPGAAFP